MVAKLESNAASEARISLSGLQAFERDFAMFLFLGCEYRTKYRYDLAGNITNIVYVGEQYNYDLSLKWNGKYQLVDSRTNGILAERHGYDALGRRAWTSDGTSTNYFIYAYNHAIAEVNEHGNVLRSYVSGPGVDRWIAMVVNTGTTAKTYYYITDHLGTVHALVDETGNISESYNYDAWGRVLGVYNAIGEEIQVSQVGNTYLWQGREYSWKTGLYYFRARWYDPITGRWLSNDPIGISGGLNQYVFCGNDPVNNRDPEGLTAGALALPWVGGGTAAGSGALAALGPMAIPVGIVMLYPTAWRFGEWLGDEISHIMYPMQGKGERSWEKARGDDPYWGKTIDELRYIERNGDRYEKERARRIRKQKQKKEKNHNEIVPLPPWNDSDYDDDPCP